MQDVLHWLQPDHIVVLDAAAFSDLTSPDKGQAHSHVAAAHTDLGHDSQPEPQPATCTRAAPGSLSFPLVFRNRQSGQRPFLSVRTRSRQIAALEARLRSSARPKGQPRAHKVRRLNKGRPSGESLGVATTPAGYAAQDEWVTLVAARKRSARARAERPRAGESKQGGGPGRMEQRGRPAEVVEGPFWHQMWIDPVARALSKASGAFNMAPSPLASSHAQLLARHAIPSAVDSSPPQADGFALALPALSPHASPYGAQTFLCGLPVLSVRSCAPSTPFKYKAADEVRPQGGLVLSAAVRSDQSLAAVNSLFDLPAHGRSAFRVPNFPSSAELGAFGLGLLIGPSGSAKSVLLSTHFPRASPSTSNVGRSCSASLSSALSSGGEEDVYQPLWHDTTGESVWSSLLRQVKGDCAWDCTLCE